MSTSDSNNRDRSSSAKEDGLAQLSKLNYSKFISIYLFFF